MKILKPVKRLRKLHHLVQIEKTGTPDCLAKKLGISRSMMYKMISYLKILGAEITYSRLKETYYYETDFDIEIIVSVRVLHNSETKEIIAGTGFTILNLT